MECVEELMRAIFLNWVGDIKEAQRYAEDCYRDLSEAREIKKKAYEVRRNVEEEFELAEELRKKGISSSDIIAVALMELARRLSNTIGKEGYIEASNEKAGIKYTIIDLGYKKVIRGYCEECDAKDSITNLKEAVGILMVSGKLIYAEVLSGNVERALNEIIRTVKGKL